MTIFMFFFALILFILLLRKNAMWEFDETISDAHMQSHSKLPVFIIAQQEGDSAFVINNCSIMSSEAHHLWEQRRVFEVLLILR